MKKIEFFDKNMNIYINLAQQTISSTSEVAVGSIFIDKDGQQKIGTNKEIADMRRPKKI